MTKDIPDWSVAVGNPCRVVKKITEEDKQYYFKDRKFDDEAWEVIERSVKTKSFPGQSCDEKTLYRIHLGISGDAMQSFLLYLCDRRQEILPDFAMAKKM